LSLLSTHIIMYVHTHARTNHSMQLSQYGWISRFLKHVKLLAIFYLQIKWY